MPGKINLNSKELDELIASTEAGGGDTSELKKLRMEVGEETRPRQPARRQVMQLGAREEEAAEERLNREAGDLFPDGITADVFHGCMELDRDNSQEDLRKMCLEAGLSPAGHKKLLAA
ncbi:MAG: hypothetical protein RX318_12010, partial [bacterium]|nr:hypothetical protein [bacterium]